MPLSSMPPPSPEWTSLLGAILISVISGIISITQRVARGHAPSFVWVCSEFLTAILCGYLMYNSYSSIEAYMPDWMTKGIAVAFVAHSGGRIIQEMEKRVLGRK
ncbi:hypothetical protein [Vreelandella venusta]|uniref:hypothetical protein n=1 Tax=Vreelandella venusta TaxID=44935 RepID=UPI00116DE447|nr:hypothetical protein [Halomonas venusta]GEK52316.1 hypothetical protein HVE01_30370 [Halomonas venusta]